MSQPVIWLTKEQLEERKAQHAATVELSEDGTLRFKSEEIITPKGPAKRQKGTIIYICIVGLLNF